KLLLHLAPKNFVTIKKFPWVEYKRLTKSRAAVPAQQIIYRSETTNSLVFWTIFRRPNEPVSPNIRALAADELGNDYEPARIRIFVQGADYAVVAWEFTAFPRRGRKVTLRLYDKGGYHTNRMFLTEWTAPNPDRGP